MRDFLTGKFSRNFEEKFYKNFRHRRVKGRLTHRRNLFRRVWHPAEICSEGSDTLLTCSWLPVPLNGRFIKFTSLFHYTTQGQNDQCLKNLPGSNVLSVRWDIGPRGTTCEFKIFQQILKTNLKKIRVWIGCT